MLAATIDPTTRLHRYETPADFKIVQGDGEIVAVPQNVDARAAYFALQQALNRILIGLELGSPLELTGTIDGATVRAAIIVAGSDKTVRTARNSFCGFTQVALKDIPQMRELLKLDADALRLRLAAHARRDASFLNILADMIWYGTLTNIPPCPLPVTTTKPAKPNRVPVIAAAAVGLALGSAVVLAIFLPR